MTTTAAPSTPHRLFRDLDRPSQVVSHFTPNWFAAVMGTGIVAVAASSLPYQSQLLHTAAIAVWALATTVLVVVVAATAAHWLRYPAVARGHFSHPVMAHFHGAPPMALLTVGAGALLVGRDVIGLPAAVTVDAVLWIAGTVLGLATAIVVPWRMTTRGAMPAERAFGGWLMPVVPPMVSASTGALLVPHLPAGAPRLALFAACYVMFALAAVASAVVIVRIVRRVRHHGVGEAASVPTLWIVLGPLGQSVTAVNLLGGVAPLVVRPGTARALHVSGLVYGLPVWAAALGWAALAAVVTARTARERLPFGLTWWSFTFPVGTVVTATSGLALHTGSSTLADLAVVLFVALVAAWLTVAVRTVAAAGRGWVFLPPTG
ncbi:TDT family transporter [Jatrophihabitans sp. YIM 134969]